MKINLEIVKVDLEKGKMFSRNKITIHSVYVM